jgi:hypothetical protein
LKPPYTEEHGWDSNKVNRVISRCALAIEQAVNNGDLGLVSCSVVLSDYKAEKRRTPDQAPIEQLCSEYCVGIPLVWYGERLYEDGASLFFDRDDSFGGHVLNMWNRKDVKRRPAWRAITHIGRVDMKKVPCVQAADLLSWSINRAYKDGGATYDWQQQMLGLEMMNRFIDAAFFREVPRIEENVSRYHRLKLPPRRPIP